MNDIYIPKKIPRIEVREHLHGHTKIELRNVRTGRVERVEHDNMFTDGIESYCTSQGQAANGYFGQASPTGKIWATVLGGIFLFDSALPTTAKYMPAGTTMTANASYGVSNSGTTTELGSYNSVESASSQNSISLVYDWGTSQGNGTIASVALSTAVGGYIGYGNATSRNRAGTKDGYEGQQSIELNTIVAYYMNASAQPLEIYESNGVWLKAGASAEFSNSFALTKYYIPLTSVDVFYARTNEAIKTYTVNVQGGRFLAHAAIGHINGVEKFVFVVNTNNSQYIIKNAGFKLVIADPVAETTTIYELTNQDTGNSAMMYIKWIDDTYLWISADNNRTYKIAYASNTWQSETRPSSLNTIQMLTDQLVLGSANDVWDPVLNRSAPINGRYVWNSGSNYYMLYHAPSVDALAYSTRYNSGNFSTSRKLYKNPLRLMTINNLDDTLTKDATKTMKVTYTITRSA